jgi:hypothetical protein
MIRWMARVDNLMPKKKPHDPCFMNYMLLEIDFSLTKQKKSLFYPFDNFCTCSSTTTIAHNVFDGLCSRMMVLCSYHDLIIINILGKS